MDKLYIMVDGSNVALSRRTNKKKAKFHNLELIIELLRKLEKIHSIEWEIVVDASLRHRIDDKNALEKLIKIGIITQCPKCIKADEFIIEFFKRHPENTVIISNDFFDEYNIPNLIVHRFIIVFDEILLNPKLEEKLI